MQSRETLNSEHDRHDRVLVARYAAGDAYPSEMVEATDLVDNCDGCAALAADIRLISAKTADLPTAKRPRDFRLTPEQADKLRGSWFDRLMRGFSTPGWSVVRPVAAASLAIGMVLIVVGALPISLTGGTSSEAVSGQDHTTYGYRSGVPSSTFAPAYAPALASAASVPIAAASIAPQQAPAASPIPEGAGGLSGTFAAVDSASSMAASTTAPNPPDVNQQSVVPEPPKLASVAPATSDTTGKVVAGPSAPPPPADLSGAASGQAQVGTVEASSLDRSSLVLIGMVLAFVALMALALVWLARRRYSEPFVR